MKFSLAYISAPSPECVGCNKSGYGIFTLHIQYDKLIEALTNLANVEEWEIRVNSPLVHASVIQICVPLHGSSTYRFIWLVPTAMELKQLYVPFILS
jgi:hypothetical protein